MGEVVLILPSSASLPPGGSLSSGVTVPSSLTTQLMMFYSMLDQPRDKTHPYTAPHQLRDILQVNSKSTPRPGSLPTADYAPMSPEQDLIPHIGLAIG